MLQLVRRTHIPTDQFTPGVHNILHSIHESVQIPLSNQSVYMLVSVRDFIATMAELKD